MKPAPANTRFWISGTLVAFTGVALVRLIAPSLDSSVRLTVAVAGQLLALGGLFIICLGIRQRIQPGRASSADVSHPSN